MELKMKAICAGTKTRNQVVQESLEQYREVFVKTSQQIDVLKNVSTYSTPASLGLQLLTNSCPRPAGATF